ncbi:MAG: ferredoxin--NADP reductase [Planctomycetales bacterium]|nr:ferredoxin--NADP reductase [Planctomycetales bacterium]
MAALRAAHYNATLIASIDVTDSLRILRVCPDTAIGGYEAGQYTSLGLGYWEARVPEADMESLDERRLRRLVRRPYSVSCSMIREEARPASTHAPAKPKLAEAEPEMRLARVPDCDFLEFYVALVLHAERRPPALTPRLFHLQVGDRLFVEPRFVGGYSLDAVQSDDNVVLFATGTGEAPHNAMLSELLSRGHRGQIVSAVCVRWRKELAYLETHRRLERRYSNYRYLALTTREPENLDRNHPEYVGKQYLQTFVASGEFERTVGWTLEPTRTHCFLCGNPAMIGAPHKLAGTNSYVPDPEGMIALLQSRGFQNDLPHQPGNIHFERYW